MNPLLLAVLAVVLAGPVPALLRRVDAFASAPRAAVVLWQSVALAAVLAAVGSGLALALLLVTSGGRAGGRDLGPLRITAHLLVLVLTLTILARLTWALITNAHRLRANRRRHRDLVDLAGSTAPLTSVAVAPAVVRVLRHDVPTAYCLPSLRDARVVVSDGALARLDQVELDAVLAHENAHLRARHDLVIEVFTALWIAFPRGVRSRVALDQVRSLLEMHADDDAVRVVGAVPMARALVALSAGSSTPSKRAPVSRLPSVDDLARTAPSQVLRRVERLAVADTHRASGPAVAAATYAAAAVILVVPTVTIAVPWLDAAWRILG